MADALPQDVFEFIVDRVAENTYPDRSSLVSCAKAFWQLHHRSYSHIFASIHIQHIHGDDFERTRKTFSTFYSLLKSGLKLPRIGFVHYIRHFGFYIEEGHENICSILSDPATAGILRHLRGPELGIVSLSIQVVPPSPSTVAFPALEEEFREAFKTLCRTSTLRRLRLRGFSKIPRSLLSGSSVKHIAMNYVQFSPMPSGAPITFTQPKSIMLDASDLISVLDVLHAGGGNIDRSIRIEKAFERLQTLSIVFNCEDDLPAALKILAFAKSTLHGLRITIKKGNHPSCLAASENPPELPFHHLQKLRMLQIRFLHRTTRGDDAYLKNSLSSFLEHANLPPSMGELELYAAKRRVFSSMCYLDDSESEDDSMDIFEGSRWDDAKYWALMEYSLTKLPTALRIRLTLDFRMLYDSTPPRYKASAFIEKTKHAILKKLSTFQERRSISNEDQANSFDLIVQYDHQRKDQKGSDNLESTSGVQVGRFEKRGPLDD